MSAGIDYGLGRTNIDHATGIRYGVISQHTLGQSWYDSSEAQYGEPTCPQCGEPVMDLRRLREQDQDLNAYVGAHVQDTPEDEYEQYGHGCADYVCHECKHTLDSSDVFPEEPIGFTLEDSEYTAEDCLDSDVILLKSPYYTYAPFCSPCVPGAGNLDDAVPAELPLVVDHTAVTDPKVYCFGHDWFEEGKAPYRVFRVSDDTEVLPDAQ